MKKENKNRLNNYGLWVAIASVIPLILQSVGINVVPEEYNELVVGLLTIFVISGVLSNPTVGKGYLDVKNDVKDNFYEVGSGNKKDKDK